jgi:predicted dehydrogenase
MKRIRLGILGPSEIAYRRFLPALAKCGSFEYAGVAVADRNEWKSDGTEGNGDMLEKARLKAGTFQSEYGAIVFDSYDALLASPEIDAVYIPLPPALHYRWARAALEKGKHVLLEKPFTTGIEDTAELVGIAKAGNLALHENYAFMFHDQVSRIREMMHAGDIGELRLVRAIFGFPYRGASDFRFSAKMGGGALLDCGGYPLKMAAQLLGGTTRVIAATLEKSRGHDVDVFGSVTATNDDRIVGQIAFGMDNSYKCELEIWGSEGCIFTDRIFTAPADYIARITLKKAVVTEVEIPPCDQFLGSIEHFHRCIADSGARKDNYLEIGTQARLIDEVKRINERGCE